MKRNLQKLILLRVYNGRSTTIFCVTIRLLDTTTSRTQYCTRCGHSCNGMLIRNSYVMYQKVTLSVTFNDVWRSLQLQKPLEYQYVGYLLCPRALLAVVCLSVRPMPRPKSRTERPRKPIFGTMETHDPWTRFKVKRSRSPGRLQLTHQMLRIFRTRRPTNFKLGRRTEPGFAKVTAAFLR